MHPHLAAPARRRRRKAALHRNSAQARLPLHRHRRAAGRGDRRCGRSVDRPCGRLPRRRPAGNRLSRRRGDGGRRRGRGAGGPVLRLRGRVPALAGEHGGGVRASRPDLPDGPGRRRRGCGRGSRGGLGRIRLRPAGTLEHPRRSLGRNDRRGGRQAARDRRLQPALRTVAWRHHRGDRRRVAGRGGRARRLARKPRPPLTAAAPKRRRDRYRGRRSGRGDPPSRRTADGRQSGPARRPLPAVPPAPRPDRRCSARPVWGR